MSWIYSLLASNLDFLIVFLSIISLTFYIFRHSSTATRLWMWPRGDMSFLTLVWTVNLDLYKQWDDKNCFCGPYLLVSVFFFFLTNCLHVVIVTDVHSSITKPPWNSLSLWGREIRNIKCIWKTSIHYL